MKSVVVTEGGTWTLSESPAVRPVEGEVRLRVAGCGVCGTDLHTMAGDNPTVRVPMTPGHEFVGSVVEVGTGVRDLRVGDRVAVDPSRSCGSCRFCRGGHANVCPDKGGYGARYPGGFSTETTVLGSSCVVLPPELPWRTAVLAEPMACVLNGLSKIDRLDGRSVLVMGAGTIGTLCAHLLARGGATTVVSEPHDRRRQLVADVADVATVRPEELGCCDRRDRDPFRHGARSDAA